MDPSTGFSISGARFTPLYFLAGLGAFGLATTSLKIIQAVHLYLYRSSLARYHHPPKSTTKDSSSSRPWALVTGANSGIGLEIVEQLAARDFNVILHGRNEAKLKKVVAELQPKYPEISFKLLVLDASLTDNANLEKTVHECVDGLNLAVVVNNVGGSGDVGGQQMISFDDPDAEKVDRYLNINARFSTQLTRTLLPNLIDNQPALVIFISSGAAYMAAPYVAMYSGIKMYLNSLADCLRVEFTMANYDIEVKSMVPGTVVTATSGRTEKDRSLTMPLTSEWVNSMFDKVGYGSAVVMPWFWHRVFFGIFGLLPQWVADTVLLSMVAKVKDKMPKAG